MRLSKAAEKAQVQATVDLLCGGSLRLYTGDAPDVVGKGPRQDATLIVQLPIPDKAADVTADDFLFTGFPTVEVLARGEPAWYQAMAKDGKTVVLDGTVGDPREADMGLPPEDRQLYVGMKFALDRFYHKFTNSITEEATR